MLARFLVATRGGFRTRRGHVTNNSAGYIIADLSPFHAASFFLPVPESSHWGKQVERKTKPVLVSKIKPDLFCSGADTTWHGVI